MIDEIFELENDLENIEKRMHNKIINFISENIKNMCLKHAELKIEYTHNKIKYKVRFRVLYEDSYFEFIGSEKEHYLYYNEFPIIEYGVNEKIHESIIHICKNILESFNYKEKIRIKFTKND